MPVIDAILREFDQEAVTTRRILERVPNDKLAWKPHAKSMSLEPASVSDILTAHEQAVSKVKTILTRIGDAGLTGTSEIKMKGATLMTMPKMDLLRSIVLNHWVHHRGQLSVYLRLLDVSVPPIYGPSADENPFAARK